MAQFTSFRKYHEIGRGAFGKVYLAVNPQNVRRAFKEISLSNKTESEVRKAIDEAKMLASFNSPFIIKNYGHFISGSTLTIVMEYAEGGSLHEYRRSRVFREVDVLEGFAQIVIGLSYLHNRKTIHRDISTVNVLVFDNGRMKISDFGIAKTYDQVLDSGIYYRGNPSFLAPELGTRTIKQNYATDVWALGVVLFYMATAKLPYAGTDPHTVFYSIRLAGDQPRISNGNMPKVQSLIDCILVSAPELRYTTKKLLSHQYLAFHVQNVVHKFSP